MVIGITFFIVAVLIVAIWVLIEIKRLKHKIFAIFLIGMILFTYISFSILIKDQNIDFKSIKGLTTAGKLYFFWTLSLFGNFKTITASAIKMDWTGGNETQGGG